MCPWFESLNLFQRILYSKALYDPPCFLQKRPTRGGGVIGNELSWCTKYYHFHAYASSVRTSLRARTRTENSTVVRFFRGSFRDIGLLLSSVTSFVASTRLIRSEVGAIYRPDHFRQLFDQYDPSEVPEKFSRATFRWVVVKKCSFLVF